jgi:carlactone synthase / all-trans-10'-apo-beta-carotenal 13,14-cleaving dioxygenase
VASVEVPPFMAIHYINAYEERGEDDGRAAAVIVDCCEHYGDPAIIETLVLHRLRSLRDKDVLPNARYYIRFTCRWLSHCGSRCVSIPPVFSRERFPDMPRAAGRVGRFRIPLDGSPFGELDTALDPEEHGRGIDMCSINPAYLGKRYQYAYACGARRPCNFPNTLTKIDLVEKTAMNWHEEGAVPSEPFFVARPGATDEDDG